MTALARAPGAHTLDATDPADALGRWEARFASLVAPNAWGVTLTLSEGQDWTLSRRVGTTDADGLGANAYFASHGHAARGVVLTPTSDDPAPPVLAVTLTTETGEQTLLTPVRLPNRLLETDQAQGDDVVAFEFAWALALADAVADGDTAALTLWEQGGTWRH